MLYYKRIIIYILVVGVLVGCGRRKRGYRGRGHNSTEEISICQESPEKSEFPKVEQVSDTTETNLSKDAWTDDFFAAIANVDYLTKEEKMVIVEINKCRTNPQRYVSEVLVPLLQSFESNKIFVYDGERISTTEGKAAVEEAMSVLNKAKSLRPLKPNYTLFQAAKFHNDDTGPKGIVGHDGSKGEGPDERVKMFDPSIYGCGECISYGYNDGIGIVIQLLVDDGVADRGHRKLIMYDSFVEVGPCIGKHKGYRYMCTIDFL